MDIPSLIVFPTLHLFHFYQKALNTEGFRHGEQGGMPLRGSHDLM